MIPTVFCRQWESFRNLLDNQQRHNLGVILAIETASGKIPNGSQRIAIVTPRPRAAVFVYRHYEVLYIVGGHWLRKGEPTQVFLDLIRLDITRIQRGELT
jgi:hypothetical protein